MSRVGEKTKKEAIRVEEAAVPTEGKLTLGKKVEAEERGSEIMC